MVSAMLSQVTTRQREMMTCFPKTASREGAQWLSFFTFTEEVKFGNTKKISLKSELFAQTLDNRTFQYTVTKSPQHGKLKLIRFSDFPGNQDNITAFTVQDILGERLIYEHDDSETQSDEFLLVASTAGPDQEGAFRDLLLLSCFTLDNVVNLSVAQFLPL